MFVYKSTHLLKERQIQLGSYYTPERLVRRVYEFIEPYIEKNKKNVIIFDNAAGCGAFIIGMKAHDYRAADYDLEAYSFLKENLDDKRVFYNNSLVDISREKYNIPRNSFLIQIGNPPYNDTTSEFKNGQKGKNVCDDDLADRDSGVSFLKSYNKLKADVVCVLHPLSYLIKEANFKRLKEFRENYVLRRAVVFPSSLFSGTGTIKFPIIIALYEINSKGITYDFIKNFEFSVLDSDKSFKLSNYETTDGYIHKYPPGKSDVRVSDIDLYYYTFRDLNSLRKNTSFLNKIIPNGIVVSLDNFYKYSYLYAIKTLFKTDDIWMYGNLSPLVKRGLVEKNRKLFAAYALKTNPIIKGMDKKIIKKISKHYQMDSNQFNNIEQLERNIQNIFTQLQ